MNNGLELGWVFFSFVAERKKMTTNPLTPRYLPNKEVEEVSAQIDHVSSPS